ncbi:MAG: hypothetical protein WB608_19660, partial [Terracidiphilus sp.]
MRCNATAAFSGLFLGLLALPHLPAQVAVSPIPAPETNAMPDSGVLANPASAQTSANNASPATPATSSGQAPEEMTRKISELVHAGKFDAAQKLVAGLLVVYPDDQRLLKAKVLIDNLLSPAGLTGAVSTDSQHAASANAGQLTGTDKGDYNALISLARQAKQTTNLDDQRKLLNQFMDESSSFLKKHPDQPLLWQFRAVSAISLNEPMKGYEAGQRLLAAGAADSNDSALQQLMGQLKN